MKLIAETAWHHDGDFDFMLKLVDTIIQQTKAHVVKLHLTLDFDEYIAKDHPGYEFLKERLFNEKQWEEIIYRIIKSDKELMLLYNDQQSIDFGMQFNPTLVEIHSACLNDINLLKRLKAYNEKNIPVVLGVGGSTLYEIENAIHILDTDNIVLMHGFQNYPTRYSDINFKRIRKLINLYPKLKHGYADHTAWNEPNNILISSMGAALGVDYLEKHITIQPGISRTDWQSAVSIESFNSIADNLIVLNDCNGDGSLKLNEREIKYSVFGPNKKAPVLIKDVKTDETLTPDHYRFKRTKQTTDLSQVETIDYHNKMFVNNREKGYCFNSKDFK